jgi:hypothetical protein
LLLSLSKLCMSPHNIFSLSRWEHIDHSLRLFLLLNLFLLYRIFLLKFIVNLGKFQVLTYSLRVQLIWIFHVVVQLILQVLYNLFLFVNFFLQINVFIIHVVKFIERTYGFRFLTNTCTYSKQVRYLSLFLLC